MNVFMRISFGSTIKLVSFHESQVVTFYGKFVCGFTNSDCGTESQSDNTVGNPHGFIMHGIEIFDGNEEVIEDLHLNLLVLESLAHAPIYNARLDKYVESLELGKNGLTFVQGEVPVKMEDPMLFTLPCRLGNSKPFDTLTDLGSCVNIIPLYLFKKLNIKLLKETGHIFGLANGTKSYPVGIVKDIEVLMVLDN
ncbi:DNA-directed DNA polymerase [Tanacetum coccineum]